MGITTASTPPEPCPHFRILLCPGLWIVHWGNSGLIVHWLTHVVSTTIEGRYKQWSPVTNLGHAH